MRQIRQRKKWLKSQHIFDNLYANIDGIKISKQDRDQLKIDHYGLVYGEICFDSFATMLAVTQPKPTDVFYDLGSGTGKAVFCSALLYEWKKCIGIELLPGLYQASVRQLEKLSHSLPIQFIQGNFLEMDFSDATIVFINATSFTTEFWKLIIDKLNILNRGTRIIVTSKKLEQYCYQLLDAKMVWMNWGWSSVYTYQKIEQIKESA